MKTSKRWFPISTDEIILIGSGGHARACVDVIELSAQFKIAGFIEKEEVCKMKNLRYSILGTDDDLGALRQKYNNALITVGQLKSPDTRIKLFYLLQEMDFILPVVISPTAYVSKHAMIGRGTIVMHGAIVNANAKIGQNCIINSKALIEHDAIIGDNCHISTGAIINGGVSVGGETFIGSGTITKQCISIKDRCIIGAGIVLKTDVASHQLIR
jgi:sugar O-acyltransferase (sialic acid O-acetyltransferase NeuD family)